MYKWINLRNWYSYRNITIWNSFLIWNTFNQRHLEDCCDDHFASMTSYMDIGDAFVIAYAVTGMYKLKVEIRKKKLT